MHLQIRCVVTRSEIFTFIWHMIHHEATSLSIVAAHYLLSEHLSTHGRMVVPTDAGTVVRLVVASVVAASLHS